MTSAAQRSHEFYSPTKGQLLTDSLSLTTVASIPGVIYQACLCPNGSINFLFISSGCWELCELHPDQIRDDANHLLAILHPQDRLRFEQAMLEASQTLQPWVWDGRIVLPSGQVKWVEANSHPDVQPDGCVIWHGLLTDISRHKRTELELKQANRELEATIATQTAELEQAVARMQRQIADRHQAETALRESGKRYQALLEALPDMLFRYSRQGVYLDFVASSDWLPLLSPDDFLHKSVTEVLPTPIAQKVMAAIDQALTTSSIQLIEYQLEIDGALHDYEARFVVSGKDEVTAIVRDITDRKQADAELRANQQFLGLVMNSIPQYVFWKDQNSVYRGCNRNFATLAGLATPEEIVGKTDFDLPWRKYAEQFIERDRQVITTNAPVYRVIDPVTAANGDQGWTETNKVPLHDAEGNVIGILGTLDNVTDRIKAQDALKASETQLRQKNYELEHLLRELQRTQTQMIQAEKMSSLGQLVAGIAHEINNPVNFIYGNLSYADAYTRDLLELLQLYQRRYPQPGEAIEEAAEAIDLDFLVEDLPKLLTSMRVGAERIQKIVMSLRTFSRMDESEKKAVNIHDGIDSTLMILQNRLKARPDHPGIEVVKIYGQLPLVECYAGQLNQVFMNILNNAIDALEEVSGSRFLGPSTCEESAPEDWTPRITIRTELITPQPVPNSQADPHHGQAAPAHIVQIRIIDNGSGMPEGVRKRLFDPFFTTKPVGKGTGLGLSISYQIITEKHGGSLQCTSELGKGTEFTVEIPLQQQN